MNLYNGITDIIRALYRINTDVESAISKVFIDLDNQLIESIKYPPFRILSLIQTASIYNNRYFRSYLSIFKMFYLKYPQISTKDVSTIFQYFLRKEFCITIGEEKEPRLIFYDSENYSIEVHQKNTIFKAIMDDNKELFIISIEREGFDKNQKLKSDFYPESEEGYTLLELSCYHGAVECFKLLRSKFNSEITPKCLQFSFLGGNPDIMSECLKEHDPDEECMKYAIASHNIDFVTFLVNE